MRTLSKSDFKTARSCLTKLWFKENRYPSIKDEDPFLAMLAEGGYMVEALAKAYYPEGIALEYGRDPAEDAARTRALLARDSVTLFEATLLEGRRMARVDILRKEGDTLHLIEVKAKSWDSDANAERLAARGVSLLRSLKGEISADWVEYLEDVTFQVLLLEACMPGHRIVPSLLLVDTAKRATVDDAPSHFVIDKEATGRVRTARFIGDGAAMAGLDVLTLVDVSTEVEQLRPAVAAAAAVMEAEVARIDDGGARPDSPLGAACIGCEYRLPAGSSRSGFAECWTAHGELLDPVLDLYKIGSAKQDKAPLLDTLLDRGIVSIAQVPEELIVRQEAGGVEAQRRAMQVRHTCTGTTWYGPGLRDAVEKVRYPLHFIDFETTRTALPYHAAMRPYGQLAFQWSCHTVTAPGATPTHREWLDAGTGWPNADFAHALREAIGEEGTILTWSHHEASVMRDVSAELLRFATTTTGLATWLHDTATGGRILDLAELARRDFFTPAMKGRYGIKYVLDALWRLDPRVRDDHARWTGTTADATTGPYAALPALDLGGEPIVVREGTAAMRAYEALRYGQARVDQVSRAAWRALLLQYCRLDTLAMVLVWEHWRRATTEAVSTTVTTVRHGPTTPTGGQLIVPEAT